MLAIDDRKAALAADRRFALWNLGFRPFYLLAALFAAVSVVLWVLQYAGALPFAYVRGPNGHGSEMIFGYAVAVIAGFLFTAARNWSGQPTPSGALLAGYAALWIAGRVLAATPYTVASAFVNAAFPVAVAVGLAVPLVRGRNRRNYFFVALLALLGAAALALQLSFAGLFDWPERASLRVGLDLVLLIMVVMGGRVIPMFTNNAIPGTNARRNPSLEKVAIGGIVLLAVADFAEAPAWALALLTAILALVHAARLGLWEPWRTLRTPLVWILHAAYAWIVLHLALRAATELGGVADPIAVHALTIGGIGGLTIGMMTRTARGHTGRPLVADRADLVAYVLVMLAALVRVVGGMAWPAGYLDTVIASAVLWAAAFLLYLVAYWPYLSRTRLDGKAG